MVEEGTEAICKVHEKECVGCRKKGIEYIEKMKGWGAKAREAADKMKGSLWVEKNGGFKLA